VHHSRPVQERAAAAGARVLGSKNVKGVAVKGTKAVPLPTWKLFNKGRTEAQATATNVEGWQGIKRWGTRRP